MAQINSKFGLKFFSDFISEPPNSQLKMLFSCCSKILKDTTDAMNCAKIFVTALGKNPSQTDWGTVIWSFQSKYHVNNLRIFHGCEVRIEKSVQESLFGIKWCQTVIPRDGFFYPHHTTMIDSFSCIPFDLQRLILTKESKLTKYIPIRWRPPYWKLTSYVTLQWRHRPMS